MTLASLASLRSNCMKTSSRMCFLSTMLASSQLDTTALQGNLTNCNEGGCARCNSANSGGVALSTCLCLHAEENALLEAGRERIREGAVLYCDTCPCLTCSVKIAQVGVKEVVYSQTYNMDEASPPSAQGSWSSTEAVQSSPEWSRWHGKWFRSKHRYRRKEWQSRLSACNGDPSAYRVLLSVSPYLTSQQRTTLFSTLANLLIPTI